MDIVVNPDKAVENYLTTPKEEPRPARNMQVSVSSAMDENPDEVAELRKISKKTGVPIGALKDPDNRKRVEKQDAISEFNFEGFEAAFPASAQFLSNPDMAAISHDDVNTVGAVEFTMQKLDSTARAIGAGAAGFGVGTLGVAETGFALMSGLESAVGREDRATLFDIASNLMGFGRAGGQAGQQEILAPALEDAGPTEAAMLSGVSSLTSQMPGLIASVITKNPSFSLTNAGVISGGTSAGEGLDAGLDPVAAGLFGLRDAAIEVGTELIPLTRFIGDMTGGTSLARTMLNQAITEVPGELAATTLQNLNEWATLNPDEPFQTYLDELPADLYQTTIATLTAVGLQTGAVELSTRSIQRLRNRQQGAQDAIVAAEDLQNLHDIAQNSKVLERDPESFERFVEELSDGTEVTDIYLDPDELQQSGIDLDALAEVSPSVAKQLGTAEDTGSLYKIPISEFASTIAPSELGQALINIAKTNPLGMNKKQAEEFMQNGFQQLEEDVENELTEDLVRTAAEQPRIDVEQNVLGQLSDANRFTEEVNKPYAKLLSHFYETLGERTGQTATEAFEQFPVKIQAQGVEGEVVLNQLDEELDTLSEDITRRFPVTNVFLSPRKNNTIALNTLIVDKDARKAGVGSEIMQEIIDFADSRGSRVVLSTAVRDDFQGTTSANRLKKFYKRFGFKENKGRNKDFSVSENMIREPTVLNQLDTDSIEAQIERPEFVEWAGGRDVPVLDPEFVNGHNFNEDGAVVVRAFHGTTHEFTEFDASQRGNVENQFGKVNYFTTDENDAAGNYAGEGPDLTLRIERRAEGLADEIQDFHDEFDDPDEAVAALKERYGEEVYSEDTLEMARNIVRPDLRGDSDQVLEVFIKLEKPFVVGANEQFLEFVDFEALEEQAIIRVAEDNDVEVSEVEDNREEYEDQIDEARWDIEAEEPNELFEAVERVALNNGIDPQEAFADLHELATEGVKADFLEEALKRSEAIQYADNDVGQLIGHQVVAEIIEELGFDSIVLKNASERFKNMDIVPGTAHVHVFDAKNTNIKSVENQGTFNPNDANIFRQQQRGSFNPGTSTITLLEAADLSTFLHESGHFFLETLGSVAGQEGAPEQIQNDMQTVLEWMNVADLGTWQDMTLEEQREAHEQFARGFEAYLFEGKAPSIELQSIFQRFRSWLVNVYRELRNLNVELNDEVRRVFDRMLATDNVIAEAEVMRGMRPLFDSAEEAGMTQEEWEAYQSLGSDATAQAIENLDARSLRDMKWLSNAKSREVKRLQKDAKSKRSRMRAEVEAEVMGEPVNQAWQFITRGEYVIPDKANKSQRRIATEMAAGEGSTKMSEQSLKDFYGENDQIWQDLPRGRYGLVTKKGGMDFNAIADLFTFSSGDQMLQMLLTREDPKAKIEGLTDQRMLETYGDISDPAALERAADEAVHNDARTRFVATEMVALQKATGQKQVLASAAKQLAESMIARLRIRDIKPSRYTAAEARAAKAADKATRDGDLAAAAAHKRNQLIQLQAAKAAIQAKDQNEKDLKYLKKFDKESSRKSIDVEYLDQIDAILERFDLKKSTTLKELNRRASLTDWLASQEEIGIEPDLPDSVTDPLFRKHYKDMTVEDMRGVVDSVKQIEHLGRLKNKLLTLRDKRKFNAVIEDLVESIEENFTGKRKDNTTRATAANRTANLFKGFVASHRKMASLSRQMDGVKDGGQMWEVFIRTMNEAGDKEATMREQATVKMAKISEEIMTLGKMGGKGEFYPTLERSLNREERLAIVLNMGNEGNIQRLLDGKGWTLEQLQPVIDSLTASEAQFVQDVWDLFEGYRPEIGAKERRVYGKEPEWVEPTPLQTPHGELRGGYYPIKYDTRQSAQAEQHNAAEVAKQQLKGAYTSATTRRSFVKSRASEVNDRPLLITMDALYGGLNEVVHDLAWHEWLIDANRLLRSKRLTQAMLETQGFQTVQQFKNAVKDIAAGEMPSGDAFEKVSGHLRAGATVSGLGLSVSTAMINVTGLAQSFVRVGPRWVANGIAEWAANPTTLVSNIYEKSEFMRLRGKTMQREINEIQSLLRDKSKTRQAIDTISFLPLVYTQVAVDTPTWWGAYQKALAAGEVEERAVALADQSVIDAQGGGQVKDLAGIQRGGPLLKLWTTFYSYFSTTYNLTAEQTSKTDFKDPLDIMRLGGDYFMLYVVPAFLGSVIRGAISGDEDWAEPEKLAQSYTNEQLSFLFGTMVGVRETTGFVQKALGVNEYFGGYNGPAGLRFYNELDRLGAQIRQGEIDRALRKSLVNVAGVTMRLPASQANRTIDGIVAIMDGKTQNPSSVVFGAPK